MKNDLIKTGVGFFIFAVMFCLSLLSPLIAIFGRVSLGRIVGNFLFFWPQAILMPSGITRYVKHKPGDERYLFTEGGSFIAAICFWVVAGLLFAWFTRRLKLPIKIALVCPFIFLVGMGLIYMMQLMGYGPYLDGP